MIEQLSNPNASSAGLKGQKGKSMKGGLFAKFLAAFQKQVQKGADGVSSAAQSSIQFSNKHNKISGSEILALKKEHSLSHGVKPSIPFQIKGAESGEAMKEVFFASLKGENNLSISRESSAVDEDASGVVAGLGAVHIEDASLSGKHVIFGEQAANGEALKGKKILFTNASNQQNRLNSSEDVDVSVQKKTLSGDLLKERPEKALAPSATEQGTKTKATSLSAGMFGAELQKQAPEFTGKHQLISTPERSGLSRTSKGEVADSVLLKAETAISKEAKASNQVNAGSHAMLTAAGELDDGLKAGEQRAQNLSQRGQSLLGESQPKAALESVSRQSDQADVTANPLVHNSKAKVAAQAQQGQLVQATGTERMASQMGGQAPGNFQQDSSASQQPEALLADSARTDLKGARGADFSAHMNYKTAQAYKPAEVMMEIARSAKDGSMKLELQLEPAHLGKVQITLQSDAAKQLQVHIAVDQTVSRQMLEQHLPQLRMALAQQGLDLGHFSMGMSSQGGENGASESGRSPFSEFTNLNEIQGDEQDGSSVRLGINTASDGRISILA